MRRLVLSPRFVAINDDYAASDRIDDESACVTIVPLYSASASVFPTAVAEASNLYEYWWIARVLVSKPEERAKGLGSLALQRLLKLIAKQSSLPIRVAPGGYNVDPEKQFRFYTRNGFKQVPGQSSLLEWADAQSLCDDPRRTQRDDHRTE